MNYLRDEYLMNYLRATMNKGHEENKGERER